LEYSPHPSYNINKLFNLNINLEHNRELQRATFTSTSCARLKNTRWTADSFNYKGFRAIFSASHT